MGLSPRGRGNLLCLVSGLIRPGSIPAWAGEPATLQSVGASVRVYPRVGGGTILVVLLAIDMMGLSPRGRGNLPPNKAPLVGQGSIPAWAGEPRRGSMPARSSGVYPRVGGGTPEKALPALVITGLSPRGRGNRLA